LIHYRSHSSQTDWLLFDLNQFKLSYHLGHLQTSYNTQSVLTYGTDMGKLVQWNEALSHCNFQIGYPSALLVFTAQRNLSQFLRKVVELLLANGLENAVQGKDTWLDLVGCGFVKKESLLSSPVHFEEAFSPPPFFDIHHISELFETRYRGAYDDLIQLQSQPTRVRKMLTESASRECDLRLNGKSTQSSQSLISARSIVRCAHWSALRFEMRTLMKLYEKYHPETQDGRLLPEAFNSALMVFEAVSRRLFDRTATAIHKALKELPSFREHFSGSDHPRHVLRSSEDLYRRDPLSWHLLELVKFKHEFFRSAPFHFDQIEKLLGTSKKEKDRMSQYSLDCFSDLAVVDEAIRGVRYYRGRDGLIGYGVASDEICSALGSSKQLDLVINAVAIGFTNSEAVAAATESFQRLPLSPKTLSMQYLERTRALYDGLKHYWRVSACSVESAFKRTSEAEPTVVAYVVKLMRLTEVQQFTDDVEAEFSPVQKELEDRGKYHGRINSRSS
jgi:hypothetical protein